MTILVIEDDRKTGDYLKKGLIESGYQVELVRNGTDGLHQALANAYELIVLDVMLPGIDGWQVMAALRAKRDLPVIFLTARDSELDAVSGLRLGADDFLTKDLSLAHLIARVNALFRRVEALRKPHETSQVIRRGPLMLDGERMQVEWEGQVVLLSLTEFWIVHALARNPGHVKNRQQLMDAANVVLDDNTITSHVKRIRRKFQGIDPTFDAVQTVYGMGYRWVE